MRQRAASSSPAVLRCGVGIAAGALGLVLALSGPGARAGAPVAQTPDAQTADSGVWITLGADAFATLMADGDLRYGLEPLQARAERSGVVLTRVHSADLDAISERLHEAHRRCAGFMAHGSLGAALEALRAVDRPAAEVGSLTIDQGPIVQRLEAAIDEPAILGTIEALSTEFANRYYRHPSGVAAAQWIHDLWQAHAAGRPEVTVELFDHLLWEQPSVILTIPGAGLAEEVVVLGGHLDSIAPGTSNPTFLGPGADDDASGIAVLSEVIRVALQEGFRPRRTVQFMGYAAEEVGLRGSQEIAAAYQAAGVDVVAVLQLDMTAFQGSVEDIGVLDEQWVDPTLTDFVEDLVDTYQPHLTWISTQCNYACSDHASWDGRGFAAAMAFEARFNQHNQALHSVNDTVGTLGNSAAHAYKFARLAAAFMVEIAKSAVVFEDGFETGTTERWTTAVP